MLCAEGGLRGLSARAIVATVADAAARWTDADFAPRVRTARAIAARTGYSDPVVEYALDRLFESMTERELAAAIARELGSLDVLDGFVDDGERRLHARGLDHVLIVSSRTTIGVAIVPAVFALCAKCNVTIKDREDGLAAAFFATLAAERGEFGGAMLAQSWDGGADVQEDARFAGADAVVAFGSDATLAAIRARLGAGARFIGFGQRASAAYVAREALATEALARTVAQRAARDLVLYDSEGCLSLHVLFAEDGAAVSARTFAALLARAVETAAVEFPPGPALERARPAVAAARDRAEFASASGDGEVHAASDASWLVLLDERRAWAPPFVPRSATVVPVGGPGDAASYLAARRVPLEGFALAPGKARSDILSLAVAAGAAQIRNVGDLQRPGIGAHHGGRLRIGEFVRWVDAPTVKER